MFEGKLHVDIGHIMTGQCFAFPKTSDESGRRVDTSTRGGVDDYCPMINVLFADMGCKARTVEVASNTFDLCSILKVIEQDCSQSFAIEDSGLVLSTD